MFQICDVQKWPDLYSLFELAIRAYNKIDIVIANAGVPEIEDIFMDNLDPLSGKLQEPTYVGLEINLKSYMASKGSESLNYFCSPRLPD